MQNWVDKLYAQNDGTDNRYSLFKILTSQDTKYIKYVYDFMLQDVKAHPNKVNWGVLVRNLLSELGFMKFGYNRGWETTMYSCFPKFL